MDTINFKNICDQFNAMIHQSFGRSTLIAPYIGPNSHRNTSMNHVFEASAKEAEMQIQAFDKRQETFRARRTVIR